MSQPIQTQAQTGSVALGFQRAWKRIMRIEEIGVLTAMIAIGFVLSVTTTTFLSPVNLLQVARQASYYGIMAVGMVFVISMGDIDLSIGSILMLVNIVAGLSLRANIPIPLAILFGLIVGAACGFFNAAIAVLLRIPMFIVTLGTLSVFRGIGLVLSNATPISQFSKDNAFFTVGGGNFLGIPTSVVVMILVGIFGYILYNQTPFGRRIQAIGSNATAARFAGIHLVRHRVIAMTLMGAISGVAGVMALAFLRAADPQTGPGFELFVIAATIIGGTSLSGGSGSAIGAVLGALIIAIIRNGLVLLGLSAYWGTAATGAVIILAVAIDYLVKRR